MDDSADSQSFTEIILGDQLKDAREENTRLRTELNRVNLAAGEPVPMLLWCPMCHARHIDRDELATKPHESHSCQTCGLTWKPALVPTVGVQFLPGYKNANDATDIECVICGTTSSALEPCKGCGAR